MTASRLLAVLGPTNTGKTHFAVERMLGHTSGMIGLPLRLLAREIYDRCVRIKGAEKVALITGEEKIIPPNARWLVCTVEAMPLDRPVACLVIDEIQLAAHPERGHVFTDRLLHARGREETIFLGAETMRPLIQRLVPGVEIETRPRLSNLTYSGYKKAARLPPRSAIIAFSAEEVYRIAEFLRRQRGGTSVVLGALTPRTRNAQVAMFEAGEVDYIVATDAIGMGLNLSINHVAFAGARKFDGQQSRNLDAQEIAQIAGRAGRHMQDGTFGTTLDLEGFAPELVEAVEEHRFPKVQRLVWRNAALDFRSPPALLRSLEVRTPAECFWRKTDADDHQALAQLLNRPAVLQARHPGQVKLLWEVCQIPDFRKTLSGDHIALLGEVFTQLVKPKSRLNIDWVKGEIESLGELSRSIDTLTAQLAAIRTWTYITNKNDWLDHAAELSAKAHAIEDRISDALHEALKERFVDQLSTRIAQAGDLNTALLAAVRDSGEVLIEGHKIGQLEGFKFRLDAQLAPGDVDRIKKAVRPALAQEMAARVGKCMAAPDAAFTLAPSGAILWQGQKLARLAVSQNVLFPQVLPEAIELLEPAQLAQLAVRARAWVLAEARRQLRPLYALHDSYEKGVIPGPARGAVFQLLEALGTMPVNQVQLGPVETKWLQGNGVTIGKRVIFMRALHTPAALAWRGALWNARHETLLPVPVKLAYSMPAPLSPAFYQALGYPVVGARAIRADRLEKALKHLGKEPDMKRLAADLGCPIREVTKILKDLDRRKQPAETIIVERRVDPNSPFAALAGLQ